MKKTLWNQTKMYAIIVLIAPVFFCGMICTQAGAAEQVKFVQEIKGGLTDPVDVAVSAEGNICILDREAGKVYLYDHEGKIKVEFGEDGSARGQLSRPNDVAFSLEGDIIVADTGNSRVQVFTDKGSLKYVLGQSGMAPGQFSSPNRVAVDQMGDLYVTDNSKKTLTRFSPKGVFLEEQMLDGKPHDMVFDRQQNMYILMPEAGKIVQYPSDKGMIREILFERGVHDYLKQAVGMAVDDRGDLYIIETDEHSIRKIDQKENLLLAFGSKGVGRGQFLKPSSITADASGKVYVADTKNKRVQVLKVSGSDKTALEPVSRRQAVIDYAQSIPAQETIVDLDIVEGQGLFALSDHYGHILVRGETYKVLGEDGDTLESLSNPKSLHVADDGSMLVADTGNNRLQFLKADGTLDYQFGRKGAKKGQFNSLQGVAVSQDGFIYVADTLNNRIQVFNSDGIFLNTFGRKMAGGSADLEQGAFNHPTSLAFDTQDQLYVLDSRNNRIQVFDQNGLFLKQYGDEGSAQMFIEPVDISLDEQDYLYVADRGANKVIIIDPEGKTVMHFGSAGMGPSYFPKLSSVDAWDGKVYVADYKVDRIQVFDFKAQCLEGEGCAAQDIKRASNTEPKSNSNLSVRQGRVESIEPKMAKTDNVSDRKVVTKRKAMSGGRQITVKAPVIPQAPKSVPKVSRNAVDAKPAPASNVEIKYAVSREGNRLMATVTSSPLHMDNMPDKIKYATTRRITLDRIKEEIARKSGVAPEVFSPYLIIVDEKIMEDGQLQLTVSVPKDLLFKSKKTQKLSLRRK